jgi:hypothetical protein
MSLSTTFILNDKTTVIVLGGNQSIQSIHLGTVDNGYQLALAAVKQENWYALRDALNEILEGVPLPDNGPWPYPVEAGTPVPTPPEDEVIGLTNDTPEEERHPDDNYTR